MKKIIIGFLGVFALAGPAYADEWQTASQDTIAWDAVVKTVNSTPITVDHYNVYIRAEGGTTPILKGQATGLEKVVQFDQEGRWRFGVAAVRVLPDGTELEGEVAWSDNPAVCEDGVTFGTVYYEFPGVVGGMGRKVE